MGVLANFQECMLATCVIDCFRAGEVTPNVAVEGGLGGFYYAVGTNSVTVARGSPQRLFFVQMVCPCAREALPP